MPEILHKQQVFVEAYCSNGCNASQAYRTAYPNCKSGWDAHGARLIGKDSIKQAIADNMAEKQAKIDYNYAQAIKELDEVITNLKQAKLKGNVQVGQALISAIREKNAITGLHKQVISSGDVPKHKQFSDKEVETLKKAAIELTSVP